MVFRVDRPSEGQANRLPMDLAGRLPMDLAGRLPMDLAGRPPIDLVDRLQGDRVDRPLADHREGRVDRREVQDGDDSHLGRQGPGRV